jgi:chromosome partitioning protein
MIILIGSEKGGVGKSTLATNLTAFFALKKIDVVLVDADRQSTAANWVQDRNDLTDVKIDCVRQYENIKQTLLSLDKRYEIVVVDCQGRDSKELRTGLLVSDIILIPFRPSQWDLDTLPTMVELVKDAKDFNEKLKACAVFTMCPTHHQINELDEAKEFFYENTEITLLDSRTHDRKIYRDAASAGLSVLEMQKLPNKAGEEIKNIANELLQFISR